jgi:hypothetical protein
MRFFLNSPTRQWKSPREESVDCRARCFAAGDLNRPSDLPAMKLCGNPWVIRRSGRLLRSRPVLARWEKRTPTRPFRGISRGRKLRLVHFPQRHWLRSRWRYMHLPAGAARLPSRAHSAGRVRSAGHRGCECHPASCRCSQ